MFLIRVLLAVGVLMTFGQAYAQEDFGCGKIVSDVEGGCFLFRLSGGGLFVLDNYGGFVDGDSVQVIGTRTTISGPNCPMCGTFSYPCIVNVEITACGPAGGCCEGYLGDVNSSGGEPTIGDVSMMINGLFITGDCAGLSCLVQADFNQSGGCDATCEDITIGDITAMVDCLFISECWFFGWPMCPVCP